MWMCYLYITICFLFKCLFIYLQHLDKKLKALIKAVL